LETKHELGRTETHTLNAAEIMGSGSSLDAALSVRRLVQVQVPPLVRIVGPVGLPLTVRFRRSNSFSSMIRCSSLSDGVDCGLSVDIGWMVARCGRMKCTRLSGLMESFEMDGLEQGELRG
jgi:hypothetical protein